MGSCKVDLINPFIYGYAQPSKAGRGENNLETQLYQPEKYGVRSDLLFVDNGSGITFDRQAGKAC